MKKEKYSKAVKLAIGMPTSGSIKSKTVFALIRLIKNLECKFMFIEKEGSILHWNREQIVKMAIEKECTHLLFVDSDMSFEGDAANRLLAREKDIVGVHYNARKFPPTTTVHMNPEKRARIKEDHPDGFLTCEAVATGFMLIKLDIFKKLPQPWFFWKSDDKGDVTEGEDYWFCRQAREAGFEIWVDLNVKMGHIGDHVY